LFKLTENDLTKDVKDIVKANGEYIEFHFEKMVIKFHIPEAK